MPDQRQSDVSTSRHGAIRALRRRLPIFLVIALLVPAASIAWSVTREKEYTSSTSLLFREDSLATAFLGTPSFRSTGDAAREAATNLKLVTLDTVAERAARRLGRGFTRSEVSGAISVNQEGLSNIVNISATHEDPRTAARIAQTFAEEFIVFRREADQEKMARAQKITEQQYEALSPTAKLTPQGRLLRDRSQQLEVLASLQTGGAELVQDARVPSSPSYPKPLRSAILALGLGILLGLMLALLIDRLDRRIQDPDEMRDTFERPILAAIPHSRRLGKSPTILAQDAATAEAFRMLRANLRYFNVDRSLKSVLITSAAPGDGKSTVATNLAAAAAASGMRTLLLEVDLRHPTIARGLGIPSSPGLTHVLARDARLTDVIRTVPALPGDLDPKSRRTFDVIVSGPLPPNPTDLIESDRMRQILRQAEEGYDFVVVDTPPTAVVSDAIPLVTEVAGVIVVGRVAKSTRESLLHLRHQLDHLEAPTLGVVVNDVTSKSGGYGYAYGYGYGDGYQPDPEAIDETLTVDAADPPPDETRRPGDTRERPGSPRDRAGDPVAVAEAPARVRVKATAATTNGGPHGPDEAPRQAPAKPAAPAQAQPAPAPRRRGGLMSRLSPRSPKR